MLSSKFAATGIFVGRAVLPSLNDKQAQFILSEILIARDKMGLSPDDKAAELLDKRYLEKLEASERDDPEESRALREVRGRLESKAREVQCLQRGAADQEVDCRRLTNDLSAFAHPGNRRSDSLQHAARPRGIQGDERRMEGTALSVPVGIL